MDSSRGFGSNRCYLHALFRLGFPLAPQLYRWLTMQQRITRRIILQKARHQPLVALATVASDCW